MFLAFAADRRRRALLLVACAGSVVSVIAACATSMRDADPLVVQDEPTPTVPIPPGTSSGGSSTTSSSGETDSPPAKCVIDSDCNADDVAACMRARCIEGRCDAEPLKCPAADPCASYQCDVSKNACVPVASADGTDCPTGRCIAGKCAPLPACYGQNPQQFLHCGGTSASRNSSTGLYATDRVSSYDGCDGKPSGLIGRETAFKFDPTPGTVTVALKVTNGGDADLDLFVLDGTCDAKSKCMNKRVGASLAGFTPSTGTESVTFTAEAGHDYFVVVDGKSATPVTFNVMATCQ